MNQRKTRAIVAFICAATISGCSAISMGSEIEKGPVDRGPTIKELKGTPCACTEIPMNFDVTS
jgi:hypothetical protein